jgi:hypothetical protein
MVGWRDSIGSGSYDYYMVKMRVVISNGNMGAVALRCYVLIVLSAAIIALLCSYIFHSRRRRKGEGLGLEKKKG